jgi:hypothetical protein
MGGAKWPECIAWPFGWIGTAELIAPANSISADAQQREGERAMQTTWSRPLLAAIAALTLCGGEARADGCDDMKALCKEATARALKCTKEQSTAECKALIDVRNATCTQIDLVCKPSVGEPE